MGNCILFVESPNKRDVRLGRLSTGSPHNLFVSSRLLFYSKCSGFTVCLTYSDMSLTMYINQ